MANFQGLLQDPAFMMGAGILANDQSPYANVNIGKGLLSAMQMQNRNRALNIEEGYKRALQSQMPYDAMYKQAMSYRAMNPTLPTSEAERLIRDIASLERTDPNNPMLPGMKARLDKLTSKDEGYGLEVAADGTIRFGKGLTATARSNAIEQAASLQDAIREGEDLRGQIQYLGSPLFAEGRKSIAGVVGGVGDVVGDKNVLHEAAQWISPAELESFKSKSIMWVGGLRPVILKEKGKFSDQDQRILNAATGVMRDASSKIQMDTAISAINEWLAGRLEVAEKRLGLSPWKEGKPTQARQEGEEWVGEDGRRRKMINGVVNVERRKK